LPPFWHGHQHILVSQFKFGLHHLFFGRILETEAELLAHLLHSLAFDKDITSEALEFFVVAELDQPTQQFGPQPLALELVSDEIRNIISQVYRIPPKSERNHSEGVAEPARIGS
jgi:hypothetical protein